MLKPRQKESLNQAKKSKKSYCSIFNNNNNKSVWLLKFISERKGKWSFVNNMSKMQP